MARIKSTMTKNVYGDGYEKEITLDNGETYIIRNSVKKNIYGDGYEQEIVKKESTSNANQPIFTTLFELISVVFGIIAVIGLAKMYDVKLIVIGIIGATVSFIIGWSKILNWKFVSSMIMIFILIIGGIILGFYLLMQLFMNLI